MSFFSKIRGTFETIFQIGKTGPQVKNNGGIVEMRDSADAAFVITRGLAPVGDDDYVTKKHFDDNNNAATGLTVIQMPITTATKTSTATIPDNAIVTDCWLDVTTAYDGGTTIDIERTGDPATEIMGTTDNNPQAVPNVYHVPQMQSWGATGAGTVTANVSGTPAAGAATVYIAYVTPNDIS